MAKDRFEQGWLVREMQRREAVVFRAKRTPKPKPKPKPKWSTYTVQSSSIYDLFNEIQRDALLRRERRARFEGEMTWEAGRELAESPRG